MKCFPKIACGYYYGAFENNIIHPNVELIELGISTAFSMIDGAEIPGYNGNYSLHLSRSPIAESIENQLSFIEEKCVPIFSNDKRDKFKSIGLHLSDERSSGAGAFGFTSHYFPSPEKEKNSIRFLRLLKEKFGIDVWIENVNFYPKNIEEMLISWRSLISIAKNSEAKIIIDISHLLIQSNNINTHPEIVFSIIPWDKVIEIHISGISLGTDGFFHDSHSLPVHPDCWKYLSIIMNNFIKNKEIYINIEHTDRCWVMNKDLYIKDFNYLHELLMKNFYCHSTFNKDPLENHIKFFKKICTNSILNIDDVSKIFGIESVDLLNEFCEFIVSNKYLVCLTQKEIDSFYNAHFYLDLFDKFIKEKANENRS